MSRTVDFSVLVRADRERVFHALATSEGLDSWFTDGAIVEPHPGGRMHFYWRDYGPSNYTGENLGTVLEADPPNRFVFEWKADSGGYMTTVRIELKEHPDGTALYLNEDGFIDGPIGIKDLVGRSKGWGNVLTQLKTWVENESEEKQ